MLQWIKKTKEVRIALAICAGIVLARVVLAMFSALGEWYEGFIRHNKDLVFGVFVYGVIIAAIAFGISLWRRRKKSLSLPEDGVARTL